MAGALRGVCGAAAVPPDASPVPAGSGVAPETRAATRVVDEHAPAGLVGAALEAGRFRAELGFFDGGPARVTFVRPDGSVALDAVRPTLPQNYRATFATWRERLNLDRTGTWRLRLASAGQQPLDAPFTVSPKTRNRRPSPIAPSLEPSAPTRDDVIQCLVGTSLVTEDPDYAIVRYRYRWRVNGKLVRRVTSAALSDVLRHHLARAGQRVSCTVTPSDGKLLGPTATARITVR